jgi:hypothetical protein
MRKPLTDLEIALICATVTLSAESYFETNVTVLKNGNVSMTQEQWDGWSETVDDTEYQLDCISANLGLTRA